MSNPYDSAPQRIGDAERDRAAEFLREHLAQGRLDQVEFEERLNVALSARFRRDLDPLFTDLPAPTPGNPGTALANVPSTAPPPVQDQPPGMPARTRHTIDAVFWVIWPITIGLITVLDWGNFWWLIFLPIALSTMWQRKKAIDSDDRKAWEKEHRRLQQQQHPRIDPQSGDSGQHGPRPSA